MPDADVDGSHIATLRLTFFYRHMKPMIDAGYIYIAQPPLFKVTRRKKEEYVDNEDQLAGILLKLGLADVTILLPDGTPIPDDQRGQVIQNIREFVRLADGLHRYDLQPQDYLEQARLHDGAFPEYLISVREMNGAVTTHFATDTEDEKAVIARLEARLKDELFPNGASDEDLESFSSASYIDTLHITEAQPMQAIVEQLAQAGLNTAAILTPADSPVATITQGEKTGTPVFCLADIAIGRQGLTIQRYKGLGEMNAEQLWETTMDPTRRKMLKVTMDDAIKAEKLFSLLMGDQVEPRRDYIEAHAESMKNLDI